ncbi:MAG: deoxyguanosinetriphosphate triphosphohydrolase [Christensenellales bacterium]
MEIRQQYEELEKKILSPYAFCSADSQGRQREIEPCPLRTCFQRDRDRIIHCKSFRRLKHKTQVFLAPEKDHYRTRLTHTLEVAQIARTIAVSLRLNENLTEAIALGHDLGHTPFGHAGERALREIRPLGFEHNKQSLRVVDVLENGVGLNLTYEVRDGILNHTGDARPQTLEGVVVRYADKIAYINHDIDDALRGKILQKEDLPQECIEVLGETHGKRINTLICDIVKNSLDKDTIAMSATVYDAMVKLRQFMFDEVYVDSSAKLEEKKAERLLGMLYDYYGKNCDILLPEYKDIIADWGVEQAVTDYIAGMTDRFAIAAFESIYVPGTWHG